MDTASLDQARARLEQEQADLRRQLAELGARADAEGIEDPGLDEGFADAGQAAAERADLLQLVGRLRKMLDEVEQALGRIDAGTYGTCIRCGRPIESDRLEALPSARLCLRCKQAG